MTKFSPVVKPVCTLDNETMRFATTCGALKLLKKKLKESSLTMSRITIHIDTALCLQVGLEEKVYGADLVKFMNQRQ